MLNKKRRTWPVFFHLMRNYRSLVLLKEFILFLGRERGKMCVCVLSRLFVLVAISRNETSFSSGIKKKKCVQLTSTDSFQGSCFLSPTRLTTADDHAFAFVTVNIAPITKATFFLASTFQPYNWKRLNNFFPSKKRRENVHFFGGEY